MPLIILGFLVVIGILIYAFVNYRQSEEKDTRTVRERYPHIFEKFEEKFEDMKKGASYTVVEEDDEDYEDDSSSHSDDDGHTLHFPDDAEVEKRKRNIH